MCFVDFVLGLILIRFDRLTRMHRIVAVETAGKNGWRLKNAEKCFAVDFIGEKFLDIWGGILFNISKT